VLILALVAFGVDTARANDEVARNVAVDGTEVGGQSGPQLWRTIDDVAARWAAAPVTVVTPKGQQTTTLGELGVRLDERAMAVAAWNQRQDGFVLARPLAWIRSFFDPRDIGPRFTVEPGAAAVALAPLEAQVTTPATEPNLTSGDSAVGLVAGVPGETIDPARIAADAAAAAQRGEQAITVTTGLVPLAPTTGDAEVQALVDEANRLTDKRLAVYLGTKSGTVDAKILRSWLTASIVDGTLVLTADREKVERDVTRILGQVGTPVVEASAAIGPDGAVVVTDSANGSRCCTPDSISGIVAALQQGKGRVDLALETVTPKRSRADVEKLGIAAPIGAFTTPHPCCQPRVTNIHRIADLTRGQIIEPGQTFSLNGVVGQRTEDRGFVEAPVIYFGKYEEDVGGGVSQYAATMFNAAFFAGLDIPDYQMHSIYIDRYPYGREATISWDTPDLKLRNNTPYGILVWPTYTDTSVTVTLYSTPWIKGDQTAQSTSPEGECTRVRTERTRTLLGNNTTSSDTFYAVYQPAEGVSCKPDPAPVTPPTSKPG
jgi:vancomycin resistance protein YoaR